MNDSDIVESIARGMVERFGAGAAHVACTLAEVSDEAQDEMLTSAKTWRAIADAIGRRLSNHGQAQRLIIC
jgi:hypothetical protein